MLTRIARTLSVGEQLLERPVRVEGDLEAAWHGLVQQEQVDLLDAELLRALVERVQRCVVPVVADPHLRLDEHLVAVDAGAPECLADLSLVAVGSGCVDVAVTLGDRGLARRRSRRASPVEA